MDGVTSNVQTQLNEIKESVDSISDPYEINLTNLLSAEDSESISTAIGGIDNLNATVQDNRIIVGTISNGSVSVSIRILGNVTTLYYLLDTVLGLTLNEVAITNTSGTLSKSVTTHSVLTENMVINSLNSDETTLPLSAVQGKALNTDKQSKTDNALNTTDKTIVGAINEIFPKATGVGKIDPNSDGTGEIFNAYEGLGANAASGNYSHAEGEATTASGYGSHAEGYQTTASGGESHAEGWHTEASGRSTHAEGQYTRAVGSVSHAEGLNTESFAQGEHAEGTYNKSYDSADVTRRLVHSVGIGSSDDDRKNAHEIKINGDHYVYGLGEFDGTNSADAQTLQEVIYSKQNTLTAGTGIEITPENQINVTLDTNVFFVAETVPESPSDDQKKKICLVPADTTEESNFYTEYVWVVDDTHPDGYWEEFGKYTSEVDLSSYLTKEDASGTYATKNELTSGLAGKANTTHTHTISQISGLQTELDSKLESVSLADLGITATAAELNQLDGKSLSNYALKTDIPSLSGGAAATSGQYVSGVIVSGHKVTVTKANLPTTTLASLGITATATELNYVDGVTSNIQAQLNAKANTSALSAYALKDGSNASGSWPISISGIANRAAYLTSTYTGSGGLKPPSYFKGMGLKVNMMNKPVSYCDVIYVNGYMSGSDVPYVNALAFQKTANAHGEVYHARGDYDGNSWGTWYKFLDEYNYTSYTVSKTGGGASGT